MSYNNVKGTHDIIGSEAASYTSIESLMSTIASLFAYQEIRTPIMEYSEVFSRGVGEGSDIVRKEMYTFLDKGNRSVTLRPEFTAGIMRVIAQYKLYASAELPLKYYYFGPLFRYERPQLGRYRQFHQFGVESVGNDNPLNDVEVISLAYTILQSLGLEDVTIKINTLGDEESRTNYKKALVEYFSKHIDNMCEDCKQRLELNPLRILDCKVPEDKEIVKGAPKINDYLSVASQARFEAILSSLDELQIPYEIDTNLVRGLDYYSETVFELSYRSKKGNDYGALGGGGHYGNLLSELGGPKLPGVGFSFGIERIYSVLKDDDLLKDEENCLFAYVMPIGKAAGLRAIDVANTLRMEGYASDVCFDDVKMGAMIKRALKKKAHFAIIIGEDEINNDTVTIKNLSNQEQINVPLDELVEKVEELYDSISECECHHHHE